MCETIARQGGLNRRDIYLKDYIKKVEKITLTVVDVMDKGEAKKSRFPVASLYAKLG